MVTRRIFSTVLCVFERRISSSAMNFARFGFNSTTPVIKEIGKLLQPEDTIYPIGQVFIHRLFAYRGVVVLSANCKVEEKSAKNSDAGKTVIEKPFYQVLIHRGDWEYMGFPVNLTTYLGDGGTRQEKILTVIHGMDCVAQEDILPIAAHEQRPIEHDLFDRIFVKVPRENETSSEYKFVMHPELEKHSLTKQQNKWLSPYHVYKEVTNHIEVMATTFYLGTTAFGGQVKHLWRYVIRIHNLEPSKRVVLRERNIKVFSLNNMHQMTGIGVVGTQPELSITQPAFQFSSTVEFPHPKGGHLWGKFKMERVEDRSLFDVAIPSIVLESDDTRSEVYEKAENPTV
ncbi:unnamed protein product, partial [Mesorhabditis belari]|uniref:ApaG domain-containing protein n=1 Tax=Mesorhabditis belari TaxID=2138241 RepID=A0AAF3EBB9_9BILA